LTNSLRSTDFWFNADPPRYEPFVTASKGVAFASGEGLPGRILQSGEPAWMADVRAEPTFQRAHAADVCGLGAAFAFPITSSRGVEAVMESFAPDPAEPNDYLLDLISHVGLQLGHLLDREVAEAALRTSEARLAEAEQIGRAGSWSWKVGDPTVTWSAELYR